MTRFLGLLLLLWVAVAGCKSVRLGPYTSPRVTGRVLAAGSGQPLARVEVRRGARPRNNGLAGLPKGGELLIQKSGTRTDASGRFSLPSERALTLFRPSGWNFVQLSFQCAGYEPYATNYSSMSAFTNAPHGEPLLNAGDILLRPSGTTR